jgi:hypothetical protein
MYGSDAGAIKNDLGADQGDPKYRVSAGTWRDEGTDWIPKEAEKVPAWKYWSISMLIIENVDRSVFWWKCGSISILIMEMRINQYFRKCGSISIFGDEWYNFTW